MASGDCSGTSSPSLRDLRAKSASGVRISSQGAHPRSIQFLRRHSSSFASSLGPNVWTKVSSTGNSSELKHFGGVEAVVEEENIVWEERGWQMRW